MIGNLWEWTNEWYAGVGDSGVGLAGLSPWPDPSYHNDATWNIASMANNGGTVVAGVPSVGLRGGHWTDDTKAGVFSLILSESPSDWGASKGFRCIIPR
jgi:formylglycine-generating enzyme required for sulfatase activity